MPLTTKLKVTMKTIHAKSQNLNGQSTAMSKIPMQTTLVYRINRAKGKILNNRRQG